MVVRKRKRKKSWALFEGDALEVLKKIGDNKLHSMVTDPPSGIGFMAQNWDHNKGGRDAWIEWLATIMKEALRVLRPGAHALVWALPRTSHWTATALEDAGFEVKDTIQHIFGTGMPKGFLKSERWKGYGTGLKPVCEFWILVRKPLEGSTADNLDAHETGALHVDACRVGSNAGWSYPGGKGGSPLHGGGFKDIVCEATKGRYPPHLLLSHAPGCEIVGERKVKTGKAHRKKGGRNFGSETRAKPSMPDMTYGDESGNELIPEFRCVPGCPVGIINAQAGPAGSNGSAGGYSMGRGYKGLGDHGATTKPVKATKGDVTRFWPTFLYCPKAPMKEKNAGCDDLDSRDWREGTKNSTPRSGQIFEEYGRKGKPRPNNHPTVKSVKLMRWLIRLVTFPGGLVLDPFNGSGSTGVAAVLEGMRYVGIEQDSYYCEIARCRIQAAEENK